MSPFLSQKPFFREAVLLIGERRRKIYFQQNRISLMYILIVGVALAVSSDQLGGTTNDARTIELGVTARPLPCNQ
jgi:hypothetical protein